MTDPAYGDLLEKARLDERGRALGLNDPSIFETYVMNFEIHRILGRALGGCVHGGMAIPFRLEPVSRRLSRDVDLYLFEDAASAERKMGLVASSRHGRDLDIEQYRRPPNAPPTFPS